MDCFIGQLLLVPYTFEPVGWLPCDGRLLPIQQYDALYSLVGATYGGDGMTNFALPDLRGRVPICIGTNPATGTTYSMGQKGGCETVALSYNAMPVHTHAMQAAASATATSPANAALAGGPAIYAAGTSTPVAMAAASTSAGQNQAHENVGPYLPLRWIIAVEGMYPTQE
jgi:microcystin-dependent protein